MTTRVLAVGVGVLSATTSGAGELLTLEAQATAPVAYETPAPVRTQVSSLFVEASLPISVGEEKRYLIPGASYRLDSARFDDRPEGVPAVPPLHQVQSSLAGLHLVNPEWTVMWRVGVGLAGDLHSLRGAVRLSGHGLASRTLSDDLELGFGAALTWSFGRAVPILLGQLTYRVDERFELDVLLPVHARAIWHASEGVRLGVFTELVGNEYAIRTPEIAEGPACIEPGMSEDCIDHLAYTDGNGGALGGLRLRGDAWLGAQAGVSYFRRFQLRNEANEAISFGNQRLPAAAFVKLRLTYEY